MLNIVKNCFINKNVFKLVNNIKIQSCYNSFSTLFNGSFIISNKNYSEYVRNSAVMVNFQRNMFIYRSGDMLWEGVTGPPGRIKKRARGKRRVLRNKVDLNMGRKLGDNSSHFKWPGLNTPILEGTNKVNIHTGEKDETYEEKLQFLRTKMNKKKKVYSVLPLKRGWTGAKFGGQSLGPPAVILGQRWEGYDSRVLESKFVSKMTALKGRTGRHSAVVMVGNSKGLVGVGRAKANIISTALRLAKHNATHVLEYYPLRDNRTLFHSDYIHSYSTKLYVKPMPEGYGLVCHRVIKTMCQLIGIKDVYAKVEGSHTNYQVIVFAFLQIMRRQETYQKMADRLQLNVVEVRSEYDNYPRLLAAPSGGVTRTPDPSENLDFDRLHLDGQVFRTKRYTPFYLALPGPQHYAKVRFRFRNQDVVDRRRTVYDHLCAEGHLLKVRLAAPTVEEAAGGAEGGGDGVGCQ